MLLMPLNWAAKRFVSVGWYSTGGVPTKVLTGAMVATVSQALLRIPF